MSRLETMLGFLEHDPNDSFARYAVALEYMSLKDFDRAAEYLKELRARDPEYVATYYQLGQAFTALEQWDAAEEAYRAGIAASRSAGDLHAAGELEAALDELDTLR
ncbi:MAG TPA: tetratricopeptide repeat protein [Candidatus Kapabacteria bacterium]|nr:tetratricopeptide repeat protein [Candidatus Kapabacteria bacterium]